jgi:hypothetical protein
MKGEKWPSFASSSETDTVSELAQPGPGAQHAIGKAPIIGSLCDHLCFPLPGRAMQLPSCMQSGLKLASSLRQSC